MESFEEKQQVSMLLDIYGGLLTERQRTFIQLHYHEDLSYGEIAETENISRQAVHDTIQHGKKALLSFDEVLKLSERKDNQNKQVDTVSNENSLPVQELKKIVKELCSIVQDDIMYDTNRLKSKVYQLRDLLKQS